jgi:hypothetical protein
MQSGFEMRGNFKEQPFIAYGALFGAPTRHDELVPSRRDYTYAVSEPNHSYRWMLLNASVYCLGLQISTCQVPRIVGSREDMYQP